MPDAEQPEARPEPPAPEGRPPVGNYGGLAPSRHQEALDASLDRAQSSHVSDLAADPASPLIDYLRVRLPDTPENRARVVSLLGPLSERPQGWRSWYDCSAWILDKGLYCWCSSPERAAVQGLLIDLPGRAVAAAHTKGVALLEWALAEGNVSRIDFAIDDRAGLLTRERLLEAEAQGRIVTRWRGFQQIETRRPAPGWTVYIGRSRQPLSFLRIYDKAAQQGRPEVAPWVRLELQANGKFAHALAVDAYNRGGLAVIEQIARRIRFVDDGPPQDRHDRAPADWWADFMGSLVPGPALLPGKRPESADIDAMKEWSEKAAGPTLAAILEAEGGDLTWLEKMLKRAKSRLKPHHLAAVMYAGLLAVAALEEEDDDPDAAEPHAPEAPPPLD